MSPLSRDEILFYKKAQGPHLSAGRLRHRPDAPQAAPPHPPPEKHPFHPGPGGRGGPGEVAYAELREAPYFDYVLVNHEGGDNEYWNSFYYPVGDPLRCLRAFAKLLKGKKPNWAEKWEEGLVP